LNFRLSQKLAKKIKFGKLSDLPLDKNPYADWSWGVTALPPAESGWFESRWTLTWL
jgi:hypothetical protein